MAYDIQNIIRLTSTISPAGLGTANFGSALWVCPADEMPVGETADTYKTYNRQSLADAFASDTETYKALNNAWFSPAPSGPSTVKVWFPDAGDEDLTTTLNKARNATWWYLTFVDAATLADPALVQEIATWCLTNESFFFNSQTGVSAEAIRDENDDTDIASVLNATGNRFVKTTAHASDPYSGIYYAKWFARVNYEGTNTTITGNLKSTQGLLSEDLEASAYTAMKAKNVSFYTTVATKGEEDIGNWIETPTHSSFGEYTDDVFNVSAISNAVEVAAYNYLRGQPTKAPQTTKGQAGLLRAVEQVGQQYFNNGYLGERQYTDPDTAETEYTKTGFVMLSKPEDILSITPTARAERKSAQVRYRLYPAGAIHVVEIDQTIFNT